MQDGDGDGQVCELSPLMTFVILILAMTALVVLVALVLGMKHLALTA